MTNRSGDLWVLLAAYGYKWSQMGLCVHPRVYLSKNVSFEL